MPRSSDVWVIQRGRLRKAARQQALVQRKLPALEGAERRERWFKRAILVLTAALCGAALGGTTTGRYLVGTALASSRGLAMRAVGGIVERRDIEADWRRKREHGVAMTRGLLDRVYREADPALRGLMDDAGMAPRDAVLRWGNFDRILLLPSRVFAPDDTGRSYRLRPGVRSVWLKDVTLPRGISCFFLVPETPRLLGRVRDGAVVPVAGSEQTTNSWGCRGPEPDPLASLRGLVLGDSFMQGLFVGDDQTPSERLAIDLSERRDGSVSILNTGHLGYSPEQYYFTLREYADRFRPHFVVLSICDNDFGDGDWDESAYWLELIWEFCHSRDLPCLTVPVPGLHQVTARRRSGPFQGRLSDLVQASSPDYLDPTDEFVDLHLRITTAARRLGALDRPCPLYNQHLADGHFSPAGCDAWGRCVGRRVDLLLKKRGARGSSRTESSHPPPSVSRAPTARLPAGIGS